MFDRFQILEYTGPAGTGYALYGGQLRYPTDSKSDSSHWLCGVRLPGDTEYVHQWQGSQLKPAELTREVMLAVVPSLFAAMPFLGDSRSGSDPEIFGVDSAGVVIPAWKYLPCEADASLIVRESNIQHMFHPSAKAYWDGAQAELSTSGKTDCHIQLVEDIQRGLQTIHDNLKAHDPGASLRCKDVIEVPEQDLFFGPEEAVRFGCQPSFNAYGIPPPEIADPRAMPIRFSGVHLHESINSIKLKTPKWFPDGTAIMMDKLCGLLLTALGRGLEDPRRRNFYGRPGEYRLPERAERLSLEYRTPGAFLLSHPALMNFGLDTARFAFKAGLLIDGRDFVIPDVKDIILNCDADAAVQIINQHKDIFSKMFAQIYVDEKRITRTFKILSEGAVSLRLPSIENAWGLTGTWMPYNTFPNSTWTALTSAHG